MKTPKSAVILLFLIALSSCGSIKSTLRNVDNTAKKPAIKDNQFVITEYSNDAKYGYNQDYPINLGFDNEKIAPKNVAYFFNALTDKNGNSLKYEKIESCCPFPSKRTKIGAGTLDIYEITIENNKKVKLYLNIYEKGKVMCPNGFALKKQATVN
jgi:hypothetical protein